LESEKGFLHWHSRRAFHASDVPFWDDLADGIPKPVIQNGSIALPEKPGLGVTLNEDLARRYARPGELFFQ
jgi:gluconate/galactonate dehydratase